MAVGVSSEALPSACIVLIAVVGTFQGVSDSSEKQLVHFPGCHQESSTFGWWLAKPKCYYLIMW